MRIRKLLLSIVFLLEFGVTGLLAQEAFPATGSNAMSSGGSVSYSVGQAAYQIHKGTSGSATQGVQQPYEISVVTAIDEANGIILTVSAYPNPTTDYLTLETNAFDLSDLSFQLFDTNGRLLQSEKITSNKTSITMSNLVPATYFVKVIQNKKEVKTFKIIRN